MVQLKTVVLDVKATDNLGRQFNVEVQVLNKPETKERLLYDWAKAYSQDLIPDKTPITLKPTYSIKICNFLLFPELPNRSSSSFSLREDQSPDVLFSNYIKTYILELPKALDEAPKTPEDAWLLFFKNPNTVFKKEIIKMDDAIKQAYEIYETFAIDLRD